MGANKGRPLTERELEIARLTAQGYSLLNIAAMLDLAESTVTTHRSNIYRKLQVHNAAQLATQLSKDGLLQTDELPDRVSPANPTRQRIAKSFESE